MKSKTKWLVIPGLIIVVSLSMFFLLLGSAWAIACAPFVGIGFGMFSYGMHNAGWIEAIANWMNKDS